MPAQLTQADIQQAVSAWDSLIQSGGTPADWRLRDGTQFQLQIVRRSKPDENMTEGLQQQGFEIQFMASRWGAVAPPGRGPEKGDQVTLHGRRHAVERAKLVTVGGVDVGYIARVLG